MFEEYIFNAGWRIAMKKMEELSAWK